ncbi:uncharacterized protein N7483_002675 [Penicillium malachiteum]|uniref:uncharacterized protein n=1 Tax=Penicillium malachiteum TaxID=1324776 RepID=UPI00254920EF|nr:uncharacterized protein N7483_002675 [Penicillium malachiteum]KAJ5737550.1 hypothetical protein N7483_002675 [Penicillium malachiteum]
MDANQLPDFKIFPCEYEGYESSYDEKTIIPSTSISLKASSSWTYCGPLLSLDPRSLPSSFETWTNNTIKGSPLGPFLSFLEFVHDFLEKNNISHYWITLRADQGSDKFDIPRWHTDDLFFSPPKSQSHHRRSSLTTLINSITNRQHNDTKNISPEPLPSSAQITASSLNPPNWKLTTTLLGPGTLFIAQESSQKARDLQRSARRSVRVDNKEHTCASVRCIACASAAESVRTKLAAELSGYKVIQAQMGECVFLRVGQDEGAVHSEPPSHGDRIFVNVVPGTEADLKSLMARWGMEYPRAWCVGLPVQVPNES